MNCNKTYIFYDLKAWLLRRHSSEGALFLQLERRNKNEYTGIQAKPKRLFIY